jgi:hypothetical protein
MSKKMRQLIVFAVLVSASAAAQSTLCKYVDESGNVTYSDSVIKGAKRVQCFEAPPQPVAAPRQPSLPQSERGASERQMERERTSSADSDAQRKRDETRRKILMDELGQEQKLLDEARKALAEGEDTRLGGERNYQRFLDRVQPLKDRVAAHERNVQALKQEIGGLR